MKQKYFQVEYTRYYTKCENVNDTTIVIPIIFDINHMDKQYRKGLLWI